MAQRSPAALESSGGGQAIPLRRPGAGIGQNMFGAPSSFEAGPIRTDLEMRISILETEIRRLKKDSVGYVRVNSLPNKILQGPLNVVVETDENGYIARTVDLPLYGNGDDPIEAIDMLKREIESLYDDLMNGNDFTEDWLKIKRFLAEKISN